MQKKSVFIILSFLFIFSMPFSRSTPNRYHNGIPIQSLKTECSVPNQIILKVIQEDKGKKLIPRLILHLLHQYGFDIKAVRRHHITDYFIVETFNDCDMENLIKNLKADPLISDVSLNHIASITIDRPNDTFFQFQYALYNYGQVYYPTQNKMGNRGSDIKALDGWNWSIGNEDVVIAILDTGVAVDHEDLINKMVRGYNFIDDSVDAYDDNGHGTFVASIAAADTNNSTGVAGVSWNCKIMPVKVFDSQGLGDYLTIASGIRFAADREVKILNLSFGGESDSFILRDACRYAYDRGCVLVAATGNNASQVLYPARYDSYCIAVGASDAYDEIADWSNYGQEVDVVAPGVDVFGAIFSPSEPGNLKLYGWGSGTSFAAPHVAGAAALLISYKSDLTNSQIMNLIKYTADDVNDFVYTGVDVYMGYGRINLNTLLGPFPLN